MSKTTGALGDKEGAGAVKKQRGVRLRVVLLDPPGHLPVQELRGKLSTLHTWSGFNALVTCSSTKSDKKQENSAATKCVEIHESCRAFAVRTSKQRMECLEYCETEAKKVCEPMGFRVAGVYEPVVTEQATASKRKLGRRSLGRMPLSGSWSEHKWKSVAMDSCKEWTENRTLPKFAVSFCTTEHTAASGVVEEGSAPCDDGDTEVPEARSEPPAVQEDKETQGDEQGAAPTPPSSDSYAGCLVTPSPAAAVDDAGPDAASERKRQKTIDWATSKSSEGPTYRLKFIPATGLKKDKKKRAAAEENEAVAKLLLWDTKLRRDVRVEKKEGVVYAHPHIESLDTVDPIVAGMAMFVYTNGWMKSTGRAPMILLGLRPETLKRRAAEIANKQRRMGSVSDSVFARGCTNTVFRVTIDDVWSICVANSTRSVANSVRCSKALLYTLLHNRWVGAIRKTVREQVESVAKELELVADKLETMAEFSPLCWQQIVLANPTWDCSTMKCPLFAGCKGDIEFGDYSANDIRVAKAEYMNWRQHGVGLELHTDYVRSFGYIFPGLLVCDAFVRPTSSTKKGMYELARQNYAAVSECFPELLGTELDPASVYFVLSTAHLVAKGNSLLQAYHSAVRGAGPDTDPRESADAISNLCNNRKTAANRASVWIVVMDGIPAWELMKMLKHHAVSFTASQGNAASTKHIILLGSTLCAPYAKNDGGWSLIDSATPLHTNTRHIVRQSKKRVFQMHEFQQWLKVVSDDEFSEKTVGAVEWFVGQKDTDYRQKVYRNDPVLAKGMRFDVATPNGNLLSIRALAKVKSVSKSTDDHTLDVTLVAVHTDAGTGAEIENAAARTTQNYTFKCDVRGEKMTRAVIPLRDSQPSSFAGPMVRRAKIRIGNCDKVTLRKEMLFAFLHTTLEAIVTDKDAKRIAAAFDTCDDL